MAASGAAATGYSALESDAAVGSAAGTRLFPRRVFYAACLVSAAASAAFLGPLAALAAFDRPAAIPGSEGVWGAADAERAAEFRRAYNVGKGDGEFALGKARGEAPVAHEAAPGESPAVATAAVAARPPAAAAPSVNAHLPPEVSNSKLKVRSSEFLPLSEYRKFRAHGYLPHEFFSNDTLHELDLENEEKCRDGFRDFDERKCLGAPYIYLTFHGGGGRRRVTNVCRYTRDGCALGTALMPSRSHSIRNLRGIALTDKNALFVAEAWRRDSKILKYSHCNPSLGQRRELLQVLVTGGEPENEGELSEGGEGAAVNCHESTDSDNGGLDNSNDGAADNGAADGAGGGWRFFKGSVKVNDCPHSGFIHPYGFARRAHDPYIYVSCQNTFAVLRFDAETGEPGPLPPALEAAARDPTNTEDEQASLGSGSRRESEEKRMRERQAPLRRYRLRKSGHKVGVPYDGTFVDLGNDEVRGLAFDKSGLLYVANKQRGVMVFDADGYFLSFLPSEAEAPVSVHYCADRDSVWVGSAKHDALFEYDATTWRRLTRIQHKKLKHPAGIVTHGDDVYVVSQAKNRLLRFDILSGKLEDTVLSGFRDAGERIMLSPC